jgi:geranylgeranyl pyrophosphate synthase
LNEEITPKNIRELLEICFEYEAFNYIKKIVNKNTTKALEELDYLKKNKAYFALKKLLLKLDKEIIKMCY